MVMRISPEPGDWLLNSTIFHNAIEAILNQIRVDRTKEIPDVAGYSNNGKVFFIDRRMPRGYKKNGRIILTDRFLICHEVIEKLLLSTYRLPYQFGHQIALRIERDYVISERVDWNDYNRFMNVWIKHIGSDPAGDAPKQLDLEPYYDEHDFSDLKKMHKSLILPKRTDVIPAGHGVAIHGNHGN